MPLLKRYKSISLSIGSYIAGFVWSVFSAFVIGSFWHDLFPPPESPDVIHALVNLGYLPFLALIALGIYFASKGLARESLWLGIIAELIGLFLLAFGIFFYIFAFSWSTTSG